jgi:hypothetical protein
MNYDWHRYTGLENALVSSESGKSPGLTTTQDFACHSSIKRERMLFVRYILLSSLMAILLMCSRVSAWSESGHHIIAVLAFDLLTETEQNELLRILAAHPRYDEDFSPPDKIRNVNRWRIGRAGYWPDVARRQPKYNRPTWHY